MYSVSKEMPLESYQIIQPADNQTDFLASQVIRFKIPRSIGFWDSHLSKIQFNVKTTGANYKMCFNSPYAGLASMIDMIRISQNGKVISEILDYATLQHFIKGYELSLSGLQREAVQKGLVDYSINDNTGYKALSDECLVGQGVHRSGAVSMDNAQQDVKFQMSLDFVSLFEVLEIIPSVVLGDLLVEIRLSQTNEQILKVLPATGVSHACSAIPAAGNPFVVTLTPPFVGFTCLADSPFVVGMRVASVSAAGVIGVNNYEITALSEARETGVITLTTATNVVAGDDATRIALRITTGADGVVAPSLTSFVVSKSELQLQVVKPPTQYVMDLVGEAERGEMFIDVDTYTSYRGTILSGIKKQTITIPTTQSRVKSFFIVPRYGNQTGRFSIYNDTDFSYDGVYGDLRHYTSQINGIYYPNTPIELGVMIGGWHFAQEHIRELEKAFDASGLPLRSLLGVKQNFVIGRALSSYGSSTNLTATPINVYLEYANNGPTSISYPSGGSLAVTTAGAGYTTSVAPNVAILGSTTAATVLAAGTGYATTAGAPITGGTGTGLVLNITAAAGPITAITIAHPGSGYTNGDVISFTGGGANATCTLTVTTQGSGMKASLIAAAGAITAASITENGSGYSSGDVLTVYQGGGTATSAVGGTNNGGYLNGAQTDIATTGGTGIGLTIDYTGDGTSVTAIDGINNPGVGYTSGDTLTITGGGANATFTLTVVSGGRLTLTKTDIGLDAISFVHHTNRIAVSPMGVEVMS